MNTGKESATCADHNSCRTMYKRSFYASYLDRATACNEQGYLFRFSFYFLSTNVFLLRHILKYLETEADTIPEKPHVLDHFDEKVQGKNKMEIFYLLHFDSLRMSIILSYLETGVDHQKI